MSPLEQYNKIKEELEKENENFQKFMASFREKNKNVLPCMCGSIEREELLMKSLESSIKITKLMNRLHKQVGSI